MRTVVMDWSIFFRKILKLFDPITSSAERPERNGMDVVLY